MTDQLTGSRGRVLEEESVSGADLGTTSGQYDNGGTVLSTGTGRADEVIVSVDNPNYQVVVASTSDEDVTFELYEATVDTTTSNATQAVDWTEVADAADISTETFTYIATRQ